ncbi:hypothetical protein ACIBKX_37315 [Streptomyces sp. NPDC050658]|uniref:hypothetical protein n=1 Tax=unclassified Streptomyces TaxID=2593676 RepID=UPI00343ED465
MLFFKLHVYHDSQVEPKSCAWSDYRDFIRGGFYSSTPPWCGRGNLYVHLQEELFDFESKHKEWLTIFQLPSYAPVINPQEGISSPLERALDYLAVTDLAHRPASSNGS